jgi:hypothetical protein
MKRIDMTKTVLDETLETLEKMVDTFGLDTTLSLLETVCRMKAEHVQTNWQDNSLAESWDHDADLIEAVAGKVST